MPEFLCNATAKMRNSCAASLVCACGACASKSVCLRASKMALRWCFQFISTNRADEQFSVEISILHALSLHDSKLCSQRRLFCLHRFSYSRAILCALWRHALWRNCLDEINVISIFHRRKASSIRRCRVCELDTRRLRIFAICWFSFSYFFHSLSFLMQSSAG